MNYQQYRTLTTKMCYCCDTEKSLREFTRLKNICKSCDKKKALEKQLKNEQYKCPVCSKLIYEVDRSIHRKEHSIEEWGKVRREAASFHAADNIVFGGHTFGKRGRYKPYRSKYEYIFALWLKDQDIEIIYEKEFFELEDYNGDLINYIPDFYLPHKNTYIEIIGNPNRRNDKKAVLFSEQYRLQYKIEIWRPVTFQEFGLIERYSHLVP